MANVVITVTLDHAKPDGHYSLSSGSAPDSVTVAANVATLVADGASPTQAHVTTLNTNFGLMNAAYTSNAAFIFDTAQVTTMNQARAVLRRIECQLAGRLTA
jgi:hypothetical protein